MSGLEQLGAAVRQAHDERLRHDEPVDADKRLAAIRGAVSRRQVRAMAKSRRWPLALGAAATALLLLWLVVAQRDEALTARHREAVVATSSWIASGSSPEAIRFSDGSVVTLAPRTSVNIERLDARGASLEVSKGVVHVEVQHRRTTRWSVLAGDFEVVVTGTRFEAEWLAERKALRVSVDEGSVRVHGPCWTGGQPLSAGEYQVFACDDHAAASPSSAQPNRAVTPPAAKAVAPPAPAGRPAAPGIPAPTAPSWRALAREGAFREALAAAEAEGFSSICVSGASGDVLELGSVARLAGNSARASEAYLAVRQRFGGSSAATQAAFQLGRMAFDGRGDFAGAKRWFGVYLAEGGSLAQEALGRIMESEHRLGNRAAARDLARRYLDRYPGGAHAALAKSLL